MSLEVGFKTSQPQHSRESHSNGMSRRSSLRTQTDRLATPEDFHFILQTKGNVEDSTEATKATSNFLELFSSSFLFLSFIIANKNDSCITGCCEDLMR